MDEPVHASTKTNKPVRTVALSQTRLVMGLTAVLIIAMLSFAGGIHYQKAHTKTTTASGSFAGAFGPGGGRGGFARMGGIGAVTAVSDTSITINNDRTGASKTYAITSATVVTNDGVTAKASDIKVGDTVSVRTSSTTSTTATSITINPAYGPGMMGNGSGPDDTSTSNGTI